MKLKDTVYYLCESSCFIRYTYKYRYTKWDPVVCMGQSLIHKRMMDNDRSMMMVDSYLVLQYCVYNTVPSLQNSHHSPIILLNTYLPIICIASSDYIISPRSQPTPHLQVLLPLPSAERSFTTDSISCQGDPFTGATPELHQILIAAVFGCSIPCCRS